MLQRFADATDVRLSLCTAVTRSFLPFARTLGESLAEHHRNASLTVLVLDDEDGAVDPAVEPFAVIRPSDLPVDRREFHRRAAIYAAVQLTDSLKPLLLRHMLDRGRPVSIWLDADTHIYAPLDGISDAALAHGLVVTPHVLRPRPEPLLSGNYNAGFVGVGNSGRPFLEWWADRLRRDCVIDRARGLHNDQGWLTQASAFFDVQVLRDPGCNVAYWNLHERDLSWSGERYEVDGQPLRFFHFSGFDPRAPQRLTSHRRGRAIRVQDHPVLARLSQAFTERLMEHGHGELSKLRYGFDRTATGVELSRPLRRLYRSALLQAERQGEDLPDPFDATEAHMFDRWLERAPSDPSLRARDRAALLIEQGSVTEAATRLGTPPRAARRALLRLLGPYGDQQRAVARELLGAIHELEARVEALDSEGPDDG